MKAMTEMLKTFWTDEAGMEMSEYAVVGVIICLLTATAFTALSGGISAGIHKITLCVTAPSATTCTAG